jgi:uncharacterized membrane protein YkgB
VSKQHDHAKILLDDSKALPGLLVVKDSIMLGSAVLTMADSAKLYLKQRANVN